MRDKNSDWAKLAEKELRGRPLSDLTWNTLEGIEVQPLYTADDIAGLIIWGASLVRRPLPVV